MRRYDFEDSIGFWMCVGSQAYFRALTEALAPHGITFRQCQVLSILNLRGEMTQAELAALMAVEPPTLVGVLDRMQRDGWVKRHPCKDDRRKWIVHVMPAVNDTWDTIVDCALAVRQRAVEGLSARQVQTLRELLDKVTKSLDYRPEESKTTAAAPVRRRAIKKAT